MVRALQLCGTVLGAPYRLLFYPFAVLAFGACVGNVASDEQETQLTPRTPDDAVQPGGGVHIGDDPSDPNDDAYEPLHPVPARMSRLNQTQYKNTLEDVFGFRPSAVLPSDPTGVHFASIDAATATANTRDLEIYREAALSTAARVVRGEGNLEQFASCATPTSRACMVEATTLYAKLLFRRTPTADELAVVHGIFDLAPEEPELAFTYALASLLQSPYFLYVSQTGFDVGEGILRLDDASLASRLAFALWNAGPDEALIDAAESAQLGTSEGLPSQVDRLLSDPRASSFAYRFISENWEMSHLENLQKDKDVFPAWNADVARGARLEIEALASNIQRGEDNLLSLLTGSTGFANQATAPLYGLEGSFSDEVSEFEVPSGRTGILTSIAFLAATAKPNRTSTVERGLSIFSGLLCQSVSEPPDALGDRITELMALADTPREEYEIRISEPECSGCHLAFEPIGFSLEGFDGIGIARDEFDSVEFEGASYDGIVQLAQDLAQDERVDRCLSQHFYSFVVGHTPVAGENGVIDSLRDQFVDGEHTFSSLARTALLGEGFRYVKIDEGT